MIAHVQSISLWGGFARAGSALWIGGRWAMQGKDMSDFLGPFSFGFSWLLFALSFVWLLKRPAEHALALRSTLSRVLGWGLVAYALLVFVVGLPFSLGLCRGGFEDPVRCWALPAELAEAVAPLWLLLFLAGVVVVPVVTLVIVLAEVWNRR